MSDNSLISWTDATWNVATGCTRVSAGCDRCYIERTMPFRVAHRRFDGDGPGSSTGVLLHPERLDQPMRWRAPRRVFVNSLADLFHDDIEDDYIAQVWAVMASSATHTFQVLTKRPGRMRSLLSSPQFLEDVQHYWSGLLRTGPSRAQYLPEGETWPLPNVWVGVSVESQQWADVRIPLLLDTPAAVRWLSCEPLLGPVNLGPWLRCGHPACIGNCSLIDWVVAGGESGPGARPMHPDWVRSLRDQCQDAGAAFHLKQWGEWRPTRGDDPLGKTAVHRFDDGCTVRRLGKRAAGRVLDGRTWDEYPTTREAVSACPRT